VNSHAQEYTASDLPGVPQANAFYAGQNGRPQIPRHRLRWQMKGVVAISVAVVALWLADIKLNGARYSDATGRTMVSLVRK
jgi:hypothetical protein